MIHTFKNNGSHQTLVLFHGTGGDENSLISLAQEVAPEMNHLALRGDVVEGEMRRFASITKENPILDWEDMLKRAPGIIKILKALKIRYQLDEMWALGFSNGANAIATILLNEEPFFDKAILIRAMNPEIDTRETPLNNLTIRMHTGSKDDILDPHKAFDLEKRLVTNGGNVEHVVYDLDHWMRASEIRDLKEWFAHQK